MVNEPIILEQMSVVSEEGESSLYYLGLLSKILLPKEKLVPHLWKWLSDHSNEEFRDDLVQIIVQASRYVHLKQYCIISKFARV